MHAAGANSKNGASFAGRFPTIAYLLRSSAAGSRGQLSENPNVERQCVCRPWSCRSPPSRCLTSEIWGIEPAESPILSGLSGSFRTVSMIWCRRRELNPRPTHYERVRARNRKGTERRLLLRKQLTQRGFSSQSSEHGGTCRHLPSRRFSLPICYLTRTTHISCDMRVATGWPAT